MDPVVIPTGPAARSRAERGYSTAAWPRAAAPTAIAASNAVRRSHSFSSI
jgi:hypothetical protein